MTNAGSTGRAIASAALTDAASTGLAVASAAAEDAQATGRAVASAAAEDAEATGEAVASAAETDPEATGEAVATAADEDPESTGAVLTTSVRTNARAIGSSVQTSARVNARAIGDALNRGPAREADTLADLGEVIPVEPFVEEEAPEPGPDPTGVGVWQAVGSPAPIERILARYAQTFPQAKVIVTDVVGLPEGVPSLPGGGILNSLMTLEPQNFEDQDLVAAHTTLFVEKQWLDANQVHQWSVQFTRFDAAATSWKPAPAKRVREDQERVFFSVVIPGFSLWAIVGNVEPPEVQFLVEDLTVTPGEAEEGTPITVQVQVTNLTSEPAEFNGALWLNSRVDTTRGVSLTANEKAPVTFTVQPNAGSYNVRVDRLLGSFVVTAAAAAPVIEEVAPTPVPPPEVAAPAEEVAAPERGVGLIIGVIVGVLAAIAIIGTVLATLLSRREPNAAVTVCGSRATGNGRNLRRVGGGASGGRRR